MRPALSFPPLSLSSSFCSARLLGRTSRFHICMRGCLCALLPHPAVPSLLRVLFHVIAPALLQISDFANLASKFQIHVDEKTGRSRWNRNRSLLLSVCAVAAHCCVRFPLLSPSFWAQHPHLSVQFLAERHVMSMDFLSPAMACSWGCKRKKPHPFARAASGPKATFKSPRLLSGFLSHARDGHG